MGLMKNDKFKWILRDDGGYVYDYSTGNVKVLNDTGSYIIQNCADSITDLVTKMKQLFEIDESANVQEDVEQFLDEMLKEGYLCQGQ